MLVIDPEECIDCSLCVPECPVDAIVSEDDVPADKAALIDLNRQLSEEWPVLVEKKEPPADADEWKTVADKLSHLAR